MVVKQSATESGKEYAFSSGCESLFLEAFQEFTINGSEKACDGVCF